MRRLIFLATLAAAAVFAATAGAVTAPPSTYTDPTGDAGTAPDISTISATNDDHGLLTITVGFATPYTASAILSIFVDSDKNGSTGDPNALGADYLLIDDYSSHTYGLLSWQNNDWADAADSTMGVVVASDNMSITFTINKSDLGDTSGFNFFVLSSDGSFDAGHVDDAPSGAGAFAYNLQTVFALATGSFHDGSAKAGGTWTVSASAVRSDNGQPVTSGASVACAAKEGSKKFSMTTCLNGCAWRNPSR